MQDRITAIQERLEQLRQQRQDLQRRIQSVLQDTEEQVRLSRQFVAQFRPLLAQARQHSSTTDTSPTPQLEFRLGERP